MNNIINIISPFVPLFVTSIVVGIVLWVSHQIFIARHPDLGNEKLFSRQLIMLGLTFAGILAIALTLPVKESSLNQILALLGLVISGIIAFSSSTIFANLMAGLMLRVTKPFSTGDYIDVKGYFGRIVERGLLDTEIQTENRELVAIPNTVMIMNPISVTHGSGAIVSTTLSLGYDIHHSLVDSLLLDAAKKCGLEDPFVQVLELGDYAVTYKASGKLADIKSLLTARSNLCRYVLDGFHGAGIEIVSPTFMNQRKLADDLKIIPAKVNAKLAESSQTVEEIIFDKADKAQQKESNKQQLLDTYQAYKEKLETASGEDKKIIQKKIDDVRGRLKEIEQLDIEADEVDDKSGNAKG
jgi:small-conductance mechanosensitive channel